MDGIDIRDAPLVGNELKVDEVNCGPHFPRSLAGGQEVVLDLVSNSSERISIDEAEVGEENAHEDWAPEELINGNLSEDGNGICSGDLFIKPVVEVVSRRPVVNESEKGEGGKTFVVDGSSRNEELSR